MRRWIICAAPKKTIQDFPDALHYCYNIGAFCLIDLRLICGRDSWDWKLASSGFLDNLAKTSRTLSSANSNRWGFKIFRAVMSSDIS